MTRFTPSRRARGRPPHPDVLTPAEWAIFRAVRQGLSNAEIAQLRGCRGDTVKEHIANVLGKLELRDREDLARWRGKPLGGAEYPGLDLIQTERRIRMSASAFAGTFTGVAPMFLVDDVARSAEWYRDHLGFEIGEFFREDHGPHDDGSEHDADHPTLGEPVFVILNRDGHRLMLGRTVRKGYGVVSINLFKEYSSDAYFWVDGIERYFADVKARGATIAMELDRQFYGLVEFRVVDCDGRYLTFGGPPAS
ncbi:MAG: LuxR C-terminal-related transcriptional regulator [Dehalococcoidia bacterium]